MNVTKNIAQYIKEIGVNLSELSRKTGIEYSTLYASVGTSGNGRELRANELTEICRILRINPMDFADEPQTMQGGGTGNEVVAQISHIN